MAIKALKAQADKVNHKRPVHGAFFIRRVSII